MNIRHSTLIYMTSNKLPTQTTDKDLNIHTITGQHAQYLSGSGQGQVAGCCEDVNEPSGP
jgi:hypothetical protein